MQELFLQHFWNLHLLEGKELKTECGKSLYIQRPGLWNHYGGPDFLYAHIKLDGIDWHGHIEIHRKSSDWHKHHHDQDSKYSLVILHVVLHHDQNIFIGNDQPIPTLQLHPLDEFKKTIPHEKHTQSKKRLVCETQLMHHKDKMHETLIQFGLKRIEQKADYAFALYHECQYSWLDVIYILIARALGQQANADTMETIAKALSFKVWYRIHKDLDVLQTLFMGIAGFDFYSREFAHLSNKYALIPLQDFHWNQGKVRPSALPINRLHQLVAILHRHGAKFANLHLAAENQYGFLNEKLEYNGENVSLSNAMIDGILINAIVPYLYARARFDGDSARMHRALDILFSVRPETNRITQIWIRGGYIPGAAAETQGMLYLHRNYCTSDRCNDCTFQHAINEYSEKSNQ